MRRREFVVLVGGAAAAWPIAARGQQAGRVYRVGHLMFAPQDSLVPLIEALKQGFRDLGYAEGKNLVIENRSADGDLDRLADVAAEMVRSNVDVIVTGINYGIAAAKNATSTIPIVMVYGADPVGAGFVASLSRPGGNITGGAFEAAPEIAGKQLQLLREAAPSVARVALLWNADFPGIAPFANAARDAARALGVEILSEEVRRWNDFESAFGSMLGARAEGIVVLADPLTYIRRNQIVDFAKSHGLPGVYPAREFMELGGLISYGANLRDYWRRAAVYVDKIFEGTQPADLPVEQPTRFELTINLKTAKTLGLTIPPTILARADEIIE